MGPGVEDYTQFICPAGHYCLTGTVQATQYPCPGQCVVMACTQLLLECSRVECFAGHWVYIVVCTLTDVFYWVRGLCVRPCFLLPMPYNQSHTVFGGFISISGR